MCVVTPGVWHASRVIDDQVVFGATADQFGFHHVFLAVSKLFELCVVLADSLTRSCSNSFVFILVFAVFHPSFHEFLPKVID